MDFWIPVLIIFLSAVVGAIVRMQSRDGCLAVFQNCYVFVKLKDGRWISGGLGVFANSLELKYGEAPALGGRFQKISYVFYEDNIANIDRILRLSPRPDTAEYKHWRKEIDRLQHPTMFRILARKIRNVAGILRDAFAQAVPVVFGAAKKRSWLGRVSVPDDKVGEMGRTIVTVIPNAYEPILEKYLGHKVVIERPGDGNHEEVGALQEYTGRFILARDVHLLQEIPPEPGLTLLPDDIFDVIFPRQLYVVRHLAAAHNGEPNESRFGGSRVIEPGIAREPAVLTEK